jgi:xyloglucan 6-xylosyltransferase
MLNASVYLIRNCQWSLDLLHAWVQMGPRGPIRIKVGKAVTAALTGPSDFEAKEAAAR